LGLGGVSHGRSWIAAADHVGVVRLSQLMTDSARVFVLQIGCDRWIRS